MTTFSELTKDFDPERRVRIEQRKEQLRQALIVLDDCSEKLGAAHENILRRALEALPND